MEDKYCTHGKKKIKSKKCVTVVLKEVVINIYIFFGWMGTFVVVFNHYWNCLRSFVDIIFFQRCG